jgi:hypothetical protein
MAVRIPIVSVFDSKGLRQAQREFGKLGSNLAQAGKVIAGVGVAIGAVTAVGIKLAKMGEQAATSNARIEQVAKSMGIFGGEAGAVSKRLQDLAKATALNTGVDVDSIKTTQAKLLTFKNLAQTAGAVGGSFDRATKAALDLAATGFGSAETNAVQLGKALQDPIKGITALARSGVTFTEQEKQKIKTLVEANKTLEAQEMILKAVETQVGGTADATANASDKLAQAFKLFGQDLGTILLPVFEKITAAISDELLPRLQETLPAVVQEIADAVDQIDFKQLAQDIANSVGWLIENGPKLIEVAKVIGIFVATLWTIDTALKAVAAAQALWNLALLANPLGLAIAGLGLLLAATAAVAGATKDYTNKLEVANKNTGAAKEANSRLADALTGAGMAGSWAADKFGSTNTALEKYKENARVVQGIDYAPHTTNINQIENAWQKAQTAAQNYANSAAGQGINTSSLAGVLAASGSGATTAEQIISNVSSGGGAVSKTVSGMKTLTQNLQTEVKKQAAFVRLTEKKGLSEGLASQILGGKQPLKTAAKIVQGTQKAANKLQNIFNKTSAGQAEAANAAAAASAAAAAAAQAAAQAAAEQAAREAAILAERQRVYESFAHAVTSTFSNIKEQILSAFSLPSLGGSTNSIIRNMDKLLARVKAFSANITKLSSMGLDPKLLQQVINAGPIAGAKLAANLVSGGVGGLNAINAGYNELGTVAGEIGMTGTQALFGTQAQQSIYNININGGLDSGASIGKAVVDAVKAYERTSGPVWQGA